MKSKKLQILFFSIFFSVTAAENSNEIIKEATDSLTHNNEYLEKVEELKKTMENNGFERNVKKYKTEISQILELPSTAEKDHRYDMVTRNAVPLLFISASIPKKVLRRYAIQMERFGGLLILNGTVGAPNKMQPTIALFSEILIKNELCKVNCETLKTQISIDPRLFDNYKIKQVPALVVVKKFNTNEYFDGAQESLPVGSTDIVYGDSTLKGLIQAHYDLTESSLSLELLKL